MSIAFSPHALTMLAARDIAKDWVERTVTVPDIVEPDPTHPDRIRAFRAIPERGGVVLRVVYTRDGDDVRIVTAFLDRSRRPAP